MEKQTYTFEDFLSSVNPYHQEFVEKTHDFLLQNGYKIKIQLAKNGYVVSYTHGKTKKVTLNFVFRKTGLVIRIYGDHVNQYMDFIETLPDGMVKNIDKAPVCKRLIDPTTCNSRCMMGYHFTLKGNQYKKCRYNGFMFEVNPENIPYITSFLEYEVRERAVI